jgi:hypothetical protein
MSFFYLIIGYQLNIKKAIGNDILYDMQRSIR